MSDYEYDRIESGSGRFTAIITYDTDCECPRDFDGNQWHLVSNYRNHSLSEGELTIKDLMENRHKYERDYIIVPVYGYIHGGIVLSLEPFECRFDSGKAYIAYISRAELRKIHNVKKITEKVMKAAMDELKAEVDILSEWLDGKCFSVMIENEEGDCIDSCGGFYGDKSAREYAETTLEYHEKQDLKLRIA